MNKLFLWLVFLVHGCVTGNIGEVVKVCAYDYDAKLHCGTAFPVEHKGQTKFLTCAHIFDGNWPDAKKWIQHEYFGAIDIEIDYYDREEDIVVFTASTYEFGEWTLCEGTVLLEPVTAYSACPVYETSSGELTAPFYGQTGNDNTRMLLSTDTREGNSGSPILADIPECVLGMVIGSAVGKNKTMAVRYDDLQRALKRKTQVLEGNK